MASCSKSGDQLLPTIAGVALLSKYVQLVDRVSHAEMLVGLSHVGGSPPSGCSSEADEGGSSSEAERLGYGKKVVVVANAHRSPSCK